MPYNYIDLLTKHFNSPDYMFISTCYGLRWPDLQLSFVSALILGTLQGIVEPYVSKFGGQFSGILQLRLHAQSYLYSARLHLKRKFSNKFAFDMEQPRPTSHDLSALFVWIQKVNISDKMEN